MIGTGEIRTIKQLCSEAFSCVNFDWREYVVTDPRFVRPIEAGPTVADASKALHLRLGTKDFAYPSGCNDDG